MISAEIQRESCEELCRPEEVLVDFSPHYAPSYNVTLPDRGTAALNI